MIFIPVAIIVFILFLPALFLLGFFHIIGFGFEKLGFSPEITFLILLFILIGSAINIPLTRQRFEYIEETRFFGFFSRPATRVSGLYVNLGGAVIPFLLSLYFLTMVPLKPALTATFVMIIVSKSLAKIVPGKGIVLPALIPPIAAGILALIISPSFAAPVAYISGVLGTLIGADILNLSKAMKTPGLVSIGGAGVFDGIFLVGIFSALLS